MSLINVRLMCTSAARCHLYTLRGNGHTTSLTLTRMESRCRSCALPVWRRTYKRRDVTTIINKFTQIYINIINWYLTKKTYMHIYSIYGTYDSTRALWMARVGISICLNSADHIWKTHALKKDLHIQVQ